MARSLWKGAISFGLLNIPIELMSSAEEKRLSFHLLDRKSHAMIGYKQYNKSSGKEVSRKNIVKGYEYKPHQFVLMEDKDFLKANPKATQTIDIEDFINLEDLDFLLFDKPYYMVPGKNGEKGYVLLKKVLEETKKVAIARFVLRNTQHLVSIIPKGPYLILELLRFAHEIQEVAEADFLDEAKLKKVKISPKELKMAKDLVAGMTSEWKPSTYKDTYQDELLKYIKNKVKNGDVKEAAEAEDVESDNTNVIDLMPLLQKSLAAKPKKKTKATKRSHA